MSVIKLWSRGMLGQRKADLGLKAAQRKKKTTHADIFDSSKIPKGCDCQNPPTNTWKIPRMLSEVSTWWVVNTLQLCIHTVDVARRRRRKEELRGHLSGAHTWGGRWDIRWDNPLY